MGRFNESDPLRSFDPMMGMGLHRYVLGYGNSLRYVDPDGRIGIFNDGTWNDRDDPRTIADNAFTNVARLEKLYDGKTLYQDGIGTDSHTKHACGMTGCGFNGRVNAAYEAIQKVYSDPNSTKEDLQIDIFGFSRGAAESRALANKLIREGVLVESRKRVWTPDFSPAGGSWKEVITQRNVDAQIRYLGLFDTVPALGMPTDPESSYQSLMGEGGQEIDFSKIGTVRHAVAANEARRAFDLMSIRGCADCQLPSNAREDFFLGSHSDVGGGYGESEGGSQASVYPMLYQYLEARKAGLPFKDDAGLLSIRGTYDQGLLPYINQSVHDSRGAVELLEDRQARTIYFGNYQTTQKTLTFQKMVDLAVEFARKDARVIFEDEDEPTPESKRQ
jgi:Uncharacterized alpha/beta hydrolase domain (DUF2235)